MILLVPFLVWSFMSIQDEKQNTYNIFCYDNKGKPLYMGKHHITVFPEFVKTYENCSVLERIEK